MGEIPKVRGGYTSKSRPSGSEFGGEPGLFSETLRGGILESWEERAALTRTTPADPMSEPELGSGGQRVL